jgi:hypothetical protein
MEDGNWFGVLWNLWEIQIMTIALKSKIEHKRILNLNSQQMFSSFMSIRQKKL